MQLRKTLVLIGLLFTSWLGAQELEPGGPAEVAIFVFASLVPQSEVPVSVNGEFAGRTNQNGAIFLELAPEGHTIVISVPGFEPIELPLSLVPGENLQAIIRLGQPGAPPRISLESSNRASELAGAGSSTQAQPIVGDPGLLEAYVFSADTGEPVANARVFVSGTPLDIRTAEDGTFAVELPPGVYSLSVMHVDHSTLTREGVEIQPEQETGIEIELVPAGLELPEFVVLEPYVEGSLASVVEEQRTTVNVANVLGAEAISRAGDSDAAAALKRVTGLTLIDGQFIVIRGLNERYSKTLLNGAQVPSPDPTRAVVPLDLFPADILASVVVQKTYSADRPADFGGGTINLRTIGMPDSSFLKTSFSASWNQFTTLERGLDYFGGGDDWLARDDGSRAFPTDDFEIGEGTGIDLPVVYTPFSKKFPVNASADLSAGYRFDPGADWQFGVIGALTYDQSFSNRDEFRQELVVRGQPDESGEVPLAPFNNFDLERSIREVSLTGYLGAGVKYGEDHRIDGRYIYLRDAEDESEIRIGTDEESQDVRLTTLEWEERDFEALQLEGLHDMSELFGFGGIQVNWRYSDSSASRSAPDTREHRYVRFPDGSYRFTLRGNLVGNSRTWADLNDEVENYGLRLQVPLDFEFLSISPILGFDRADKARDSSIRRFEYSCRARNCRTLDFTRPLEFILGPPNLAGPDSEGFTLRELTLVEDTYVASQEVKAEFGGLELGVLDDVRLYLGYRKESFQQITTTFDRLNPGSFVESNLDTDDGLPTAAFTWFIDTASQLRVGYSETRSRPQFQEVSTSRYTDPRLDILITGNPELVPTEFENIDVRYEYYFDSTDNVSVALFQKDVLNPVELVDLGGAAQTITLDNAESAQIRGAEVEFYRNLGFFQRWVDWEWLDRFTFSGNYTYIDSEILLSPEQQGRLTNSVRELQGQSPYVVNFQLGYDDSDNGIEATLLYNTAGERISFVGVAGAPDILEQPFHQLDFIYSQELFEGFSMKLKFSNLLNDEVEFKQGSETARSYKRGRGAGVSFSYRF